MPPRSKKTSEKAPTKSSSIVAVLGNDTAAIANAAKELAIKMTPEDSGDFGSDTINGQAENVDHAVKILAATCDALRTLPFFGGKLVWLKGASFLGDSVQGRSESVLSGVQQLTDILKQGLPENIQFLISCTEIDKRRSFYKYLNSVAEVHLFEQIDVSKSGWEEAVARLTREMAGKLNLKLSPEALELFVLLVGTDSHQIQSEIEKLDLFLGTERRIATPDDVKLLVPDSKAGVIWELGNAIQSKNTSLALRLVDTFLSRGDSALSLLFASIVPTVRNLLCVKDLIVRYNLRPPSQPYYFTGTLANLPPDAIQHLPKKKDGTPNTYGLAIAATHAHRFTLPKLIDSLHACLIANSQLVTSLLEHKLILQQLILKITR